MNKTLSGTIVTGLAGALIGSEVLGHDAPHIHAYPPAGPLSPLIGVQAMYAGTSASSSETFTVHGLKLGSK
jgi:hypothetical protein